jgi:hypothetical protein
MRNLSLRTSVALVAILLAAPASAWAQRNREMTGSAIGERYHVEVAGTLWTPDLFGLISSEQFQKVGSDIDFAADLGYSKTRFKELRVVLRPAKKHRFRFQYTPLVYTGDTTFTREIIFNGVKFTPSIPIQSEFGWKVLRAGYEYDFIYKSRGFVGILFDARYTQFSASLTSPIPCEIGGSGPCTQFTLAKAPLPAIGIVGRAYVLPEVAINFEVSGLKLPDIDPKYQANYFDWDIHGTVNLTNNVGVEVGWRRITTFLAIEHDKGDVKFQGMWFGAAIRY